MDDMNDSIEKIEEKVNCEQSDHSSEDVLKPERESEVFESEVEEEQAEESGEIEEKKPRRKLAVIFSRAVDVVLVLLTVTLVGLIICNLFFFQGYSVKGISMLQTYQDGDKITVCKWKDPKRGDVVVIDTKTVVNNEQRYLIKRAIAFGGEKVKIETNGQVYIDGELLNEPYLDLELVEPTRTVYEYEVPEGHIFYLGDNRKESKDSRAMGAVSESKIVGVVSEAFYKIKDKSIYKYFLHYVFY